MVNGGIKEDKFNAKFILERVEKLRTLGVPNSILASIEEWVRHQQYLRGEGAWAKKS